MDHRIFYLGLVIGISLTLSLGDFSTNANRVPNQVISPQCEELAVGGVREFNEKRATSQTGLDYAYTLKREDQNLYSVYLNLEFMIDSDQRNEIDRDRQTVEAIKARIANCYRLTKSHLYVEDGAQLAFKIWNKSLTSIPAPRPHQVRLRPSDWAAYSTQYPVNVSCGTIIHESLHLLGLVDEYPENRTLETLWLGLSQKSIDVAKTQGRPAFDCRVHGGESSIMSNPTLLPWDLFNPILEHRVLGFCECTAKDVADCLNSEQKSLFKSRFPKSCPPHFATRMLPDGSKRTKEISDVQNAKVDIPSTQPGYYLLDPVAKNIRYNKTVLRPAHIRHILFPNCGTRNEKYYACGRRAYWSSQDRPENVCPKLKESCDPLNWLD